MWMRAAWSAQAAMHVCASAGRSVHLPTGQLCTLHIQRTAPLRVNCVFLR